VNRALARSMKLRPRQVVRSAKQARSDRVAQRGGHVPIQQPVEKMLSGFAAD
jgi:hypothetical protein